MVCLVSTGFLVGAAAGENRLTSSENGNDALIQVMGKLFSEHLKEMVTRFDTIDQRLGSVQEKLDGVEGRVVLLEGLQLAHVETKIKDFIITTMRGVKFSSSYNHCPIEEPLDLVFYQYKKNIRPLIVAFKGQDFPNRDALINEWKQIRALLCRYLEQEKRSESWCQRHAQPSLDKIDSILEQLGVRKPA